MSEESEPIPEKQTTANNGGLFGTIVNHPIVLVSGYIMGIIGLYLTIASIRAPKLTYYISTTRTAIVQKGTLDNFSVTFQGTHITNDLSSAEIQIWNQGKEPIRREDILKTISIRTPNGEQIYQAIVKTTRDVIGFNWLDISNRQNGVLEMDWKILEKNDGVKIQIIYGGNVGLPLVLDGTIMGQQSGLIKYERIKKEKIQWFSTFIVMPIMLFYILCLKFEREKLRKSPHPLLSLIAIIVIASVIAIPIAYFMTANKPPFGF